MKALRGVLLSVVLLLCACQDDISTLAGVQLRLVSFASIHPAAVFYEAHPADSVQPSPVARGRILYGIAPGETLEVSIEEYVDPVAAYACWLNRGLGPEKIPRIRGDLVEQSIWTGKWIFLFTSPAYRLPSAGAIDSLVHSFPETGGGLPSQFLTLPLRDRIPQGASVQQGLFFGVPLRSAMLCQRYRDSVGVWTSARSLEGISDGEFDQFLGALSKAGMKAIRSQNDWSAFQDGTSRILLGKAHGALLVVWGRRDIEALGDRWNEASKTMNSD